MNPGRAIDLWGIESLPQHPPLHQKILLKAAELAEDAVRLKPPFDRIVETKLYSRTRYAALERLGSDEREVLQEAMIATAKFDMCGEAFRDFELMGRLREFDKSRRNQDQLLRSTAEFAKIPPRDPSFREKNIVLTVMRERYPAFKVDDELLKRLEPKRAQAYCFTKPLLLRNKLLIIVDATPPGISTFFEVKIGIAEPFYAFSEGSAWATSASWRYRDAAGCEQALNDALDVVDIVLPAFAEKMTEALGQITPS